MRTVEDRLRFILDFANLDLDRLRTGDLLNLREDLYEFIAGVAPNSQDSFPLEDTGGILSTPLAEPLPQDMTLEDFRQLQAEVKEVLESTFPVDDSLGGMANLGQMPLRWQIYRNQDGDVFLMLIGSVRDVVLSTLALLLIRNLPAPIRRCPECKVLFYAAPRQLYHSRQCAHRVTVRNWRESHGEQAAKPKRGRKAKNQTEGRVD